MRRVSDKMECPGCGACTSGVLAAFSEGAPCPYCGLSHGTASEVRRVRRAQADEQLKERLAGVLQELDRTRQAQRSAERKLAAIQRTLESDG